MADNYRGPTADELLPTQRINEGVLYQEHLVQMFGEEQALRGVPLEVVDATGGQLKSDASGKKLKATIFLTFKGPDGKALPWKLGINATIKKALIARFDSRVVAEWVGWVTLYVDPNVEDKRTGERVRAIRVKSVAPRLAPTFDYTANVEKRIERARKSRDSAPAARAKGPKPSVVELTAEQRAALEAADRESERDGEPSDLADKIAKQMERARGAAVEPTDEERAAIEEAERQQFTRDPEEGEES